MVCVRMKTVMLLSGDKIKKNQTGEECRTGWGEEGIMQSFGEEK